MNTSSLHTKLGQEFKDLVQDHFTLLNDYLVCGEPSDVNVQPDFVANIEALTYLCCEPIQPCSEIHYKDVLRIVQRLECFLKLVNRPPESLMFQQSELGQVWCGAREWLRCAAACLRPSLDDVWDCIAPVKPDELVAVQPGLYEARWWEPMPRMDIEILRRTEAVILQGDLFEMPGMAGVRAVRFSLDM